MKKWSVITLFIVICKLEGAADEQQQEGVLKSDVPRITIGDADKKIRWFFEQHEGAEVPPQRAQVQWAEEPKEKKLQAATWLVEPQDWGKQIENRGGGLPSEVEQQKAAWPQLLMYFVKSYQAYKKALQDTRDLTGTERLDDAVRQLELALISLLSNYDSLMQPSVSYLLRAVKEEEIAKEQEYKAGRAELYRHYPAFEVQEAVEADFAFTRDALEANAVNYVFSDEHQQFLEKFTQAITDYLEAYDYQALEEETAILFARYLCKDEVERNITRIRNLLTSGHRNTITMMQQEYGAHLLGYTSSVGLFFNFSYNAVMQQLKGKGLGTDDYFKKAIAWYLESHNYRIPSVLEYEAQIKEAKMAYEFLEGTQLSADYNRLQKECPALIEKVKLTPLLKENSCTSLKELLKTENGVELVQKAEELMHKPMTAGQFKEALENYIAIWYPL